MRIADFWKGAAQIRERIAEGHAATSAGIRNSSLKNGGFNMAYGDESHWHTIGGGRGYGRLPGTRLDYETLAGDLWMNSTVAICLSWIRNALLDAPLRVYKPATSAEGKPRIIPEDRSPFAKLIASPNPQYSAETLDAGVALSYKVDGNAYVQKVRVGGRGTDTPVVQLWYMPHYLVEPVADPDDPTRTIFNYWIGGKAIPLQQEDVIHFRDGIDPRNLRKGLSALKACLRPIVGENEAETYTGSIMRKMGVFGGIISPTGPEVVISNPEALKEKISEETTGDNRGGYIVSPVGVKIDQMAVPPDKMALDKIRQIPMATIAASLGVPLMAVGLPDPGKTYSNAQVADRGAWRNGILPMQTRLAADLNEHRVDLGARAGEYASFDTSEVAALKDDVKLAADTDNVKALTVQALVAAGFDPAAVLRVAGLPPMKYVGPPATAAPAPPAPPPTDPDADDNNDEDSDEESDEDDPDDDDPEEDEDQ